MKETLIRLACVPAFIICATMVMIFTTPKQRRKLLDSFSDG